MERVSAGVNPIVAIVTFSLFAVSCGADLTTESENSAGDGVPNVEIAIVPLSEVYFDTFDGGSIPLDEASADDIADLLDRIPPIDNPEYIDPSNDEWLDDSDAILGYVDAAGQAYAYPHKILNLHEIVNDTLAEVPVLISYCPLCNSGVVYDRRLDDLRHDGVLTFGNTSALYDNDLVMVDRETNTYWWQVPGRAIVGTLSDARLTVLPSVTTTWAQWQADQPNTLVLSRDLGFDRNYDRDPFAGYADRVNAGRTPFPVTEGVLEDGRLPPAEQIIGLESGNDTVAVPVSAITRESRVEVGDTTFLLVPDSSGGVRAFVEAADGSKVPAASRSTFWFAYVAAFPEAKVRRPE